jgi:hypothetical protein
VPTCFETKHLCRSTWLRMLLSCILRAAERCRMLNAAAKRRPIPCLCRRPTSAIAANASAAHPQTQTQTPADACAMAIKPG